MSMMNSMSRIRGQEKGPGYTQTETILGESMQRFGRELGDDSTFGEPQHTTAEEAPCSDAPTQSRVLFCRQAWR